MIFKNKFEKALCINARAPRAKGIMIPGVGFYVKSAYIGEEILNKELKTLWLIFVESDTDCPKCAGLHLDIYPVYLNADNISWISAKKKIATIPNDTQSIKLAINAFKNQHSNQKETKKKHK